MVEQWTLNPFVRGSSPFGPMFMKECYLVSRSRSFPYVGLVLNHSDFISSFSVRKTSVVDLKERVRIFLSGFRLGGHIDGKGGLFLNMEEMCPGGGDLVDGLLLLRLFERSGIRFAVLDSGVVDFWDLKKRENLRCLSGAGYLSLNNACLLVIYIKFNGNISRKAEQSIFDLGIGGILY